MPDRIVALTTDLMFSSNIEATLSRAGYNVATVEDVQALRRQLVAGGTALVILDLHAGADAGDVTGACSGISVPVLAFGRHTEPALLRAARDAGCREVIPRSTFVEHMLRLVEGAIREPDRQA
jgi:DNA-binding NtrC family response regulator